MRTTFRDLLLLLVAILLLVVVVGVALLINRTRSQPLPLATLATPSIAIERTATLTSPSPSTAASSTPSLEQLTTRQSTVNISPTARDETPTPTVTPTPSPSPTPDPSARLSDAHRARRNGDYTYARAELARVIDLSTDSDEIRAARYQAAIIAYLDGDLEAARDKLHQYIADYPDDHRIATAHFYRAETLSQLGDYPPALEHYAAYLGYQDVLADVVYARMGRIHRFLGDAETAIEAYRQAAQHAPDLNVELDMREQTALAYQAAQQYANARNEFQAILDLTENPYRLARTWYLMGGNHRLLGDEQSALEAYAQAVSGDPRPGYAHMALVELVHAEVEVDEIQRGLIDYYVGSYQAAIDAFVRYLESTPDLVGPDKVSVAHYYAARSWLALGDAARAVLECERALARTDAELETSIHWGDLWLLKAEAEIEQGYTDRAIETYRRFAQQYPDHPLAPEALWQAAGQKRQAQRHAEAADSYAALADRYPDVERAPESRFLAGLWRYWIGDIEAALGAWGKLAQAYPDTPAGQQGRYWLGKTLWARGAVAEARRELEQLAPQRPRSYYSLRAADLLASNGQAIAWSRAPHPAHLTYSEEEERNEVIEWLRTWADLREGQLGPQVSSELAGSLRFRRAVEMHAVGLRQPALDEFETLRKKLVEEQRPLQLYQLALVTRDLELYGPSVRAAIDLAALAPEDSVLDMPRLVQRLIYPAYYPDLVLAESSSAALDPLLLFALIRQESIFDAQVASWAGAVGLTQIMPATGEWIAEMTAWPGYQPELLSRAYVNVKFGAWFLAHILDRADGDVYTALAGYNGGPSLALRWQQIARGDPDLYVEIIPKDETQRYLRAIYRHYHVYEQLYGQ